jgi:hypothetical protein
MSASRPSLAADGFAVVSVGEIRPGWARSRGSLCTSTRADLAGFTPSLSASFATAAPVKGPRIYTRLDLTAERVRAP